MANLDEYRDKVKQLLAKYAQYKPYLITLIK